MRLAWIGLTLLTTGACGEDFGTASSEGGAASSCEVLPVSSCTDDPWVCEATGQTCWINADLSAYLCLNAGPGAEGEPCQAIAGQPRCDTNMACLQTVAGQPGACRQYCSPTDPCKACPSGQVCYQVTTQLSTITHVCSPPMP
jgi:hypothetical protein